MFNDSDPRWLVTLAHLSRLQLCLHPHRESELLYDWRFTANHFVLASSPMRLTTRDFFFFNLNPCDHSPYVTLSDEKMRLSVMNMLGLSSSVLIAYITCYWKFFFLHYIQVLCQYRLYKAVHACLTYLILYSSIVSWTVVSLTTASARTQQRTPLTTFPLLQS
jgi:hypothetical protein